MADEPEILVTLPRSLREETFADEAMDRLERVGDVSWNDADENLSSGALAERIEGTNIVVTGWGSPRLDAGVLERADRLELLAHAGGSVADYVSDPLFERDVIVCSANRPMARYTAEVAFAHIVSAQRGVVWSHERMREGAYDRLEPRRTLIEADVGLVGLGTVGRWLLSMLEPFDVSATVYDPYVTAQDLTGWPFAERGSLGEALDADVVSIHAAQTTETLGLLGEDELRRIPDGSLLVNTARAAIVDEDALRAAVDRGRLRFALDVYHEEPLPAEDTLREAEPAQLTPHIAGLGPAHRFGDVVVAEIERFVAGRPLRHRIPRQQAALMTRERL